VIGESRRERLARVHQCANEWSFLAVSFPKNAIHKTSHSIERSEAFVAGVNGPVVAEIQSENAV
jgi:hypothetical protein